MASELRKRLHSRGSKWLLVLLGCLLSLWLRQADANSLDTIAIVASPSHSTPTSSPFTTAAAEAAVAAAFGNLAESSGRSGDGPKAHIAAPNGTQLVKIISVAGQPGQVHKIHRHSNRRINITDKLHKFDLFIDPVCEQIVKLSEKQLSRVYAQFKQFSAHVSLIIR